MKSFSINYTAKIPDDVDRGWFMFFVTLLNHIYWFTGATLGGIFGSLIQFDTEGLEFVMTAMFVVIFLEQWLKEKRHTSALLGLGLSLICLIAFGADGFIIPAMLAILGVLTLIRRPLESKGAGRMSLTQQIITIAMVILGTLITRFLPFIIFPAGKPTPKYIQYLGRFLPSAVFGLLIIYCLKDVSIFTGSHGIPEAISIAVVVLLHLWKRQMLLSIAGGTICYMLLVQLVFLKNPPQERGIFSVWYIPKTKPVKVTRHLF